MNPRALRLLGRLPRPTVYSALELALLALIAIQAARLVWTLVTPVGPVGEWRGSAPLALPANGSALTEFDPFFRLSAQRGPVAVTSLDLKLYGVREDRATGRGSAIIALPDGTQQSFAVGDTIMPGVTLAQVGFDNVTISRGGAQEQIFLDQSEPAPGPAETQAAPGGGAPAPARAVPAPAPARGASPSAAPIQFQPRTSGGRVDGIIVNPGSDGGQAFRAAGFEPGDVIVSVNGQAVTSLEQARARLGQSGGGQATVIVNRGGRAVPLRVRLNL
ncbi:MAG TPA: type II secretion system protein N [Allosphingosinicella sp.]